MSKDYRAIHLPSIKEYGEAVYRKKKSPPQKRLESHESPSPTLLSQTHRLLSQGCA
jgi:hypothetical protein